MTDYAIQQVVNALSAGSLYALMAVGLAMVFGILRLINFAHGDVMMIAAYLAAFALGAGLPLEQAVIVMVVGTVVVGLLMERIAYRPIRGAPDVAMLLTSFAVGQILQNGTLLTTRLAGKPTLIAFPSPEALNGVVTFGSIIVPKVNVVSFVAGIVLLGLLTLFVTRTTLGLSMRAAAEDLNAAQLMGIKINRVVATAFAIGAGLAAVAGLLYAVQAGQINPYMGFTPVLKAFIAAVIGGFGSIAGAVLGGYVLGFLEVLVTALSGIGDLLPAGSVPPEVASLPPAVAPEHARELPRRGRVHRPHPRPARAAAGDPRPARPGGPRVTARRRAAGPLLVIALSSIALAILDTSGQAVLAGPRDQPRAVHHPDGQPQPDERLHRRLLARPDRVHGPGRVRHGDPHPAPPGEERLPPGPAVVDRRRPPRPGRRAVPGRLPARDPDRRGAGQRRGLARRDAC